MLCAQGSPETTHEHDNPHTSSAPPHQTSPGGDISNPRKRLPTVEKQTYLRAHRSEFDARVHGSPIYHHDGKAKAKPVNGRRPAPPPPPSTPTHTRACTQTLHKVASTGLHTLELTVGQQSLLGNSTLVFFLSYDCRPCGNLQDIARNHLSVRLYPGTVQQKTTNKTKRTTTTKQQMLALKSTSCCNKELVPPILPHPPHHPLHLFVLRCSCRVF